MVRSTLRIGEPTLIATLIFDTNNLGAALFETDEGLPFAKVLEDAQEKGYAEADPTYDVEGIDTAHKLAILANSISTGWMLEIPSTLMSSASPE